MAVSRPALLWAGATDAERVQTRIRFLVDTIRHVDPTLNVELVRSIIVTVAHNRVLVYRLAAHLRASPDDLTSGRSGTPGMVADLIRLTTHAGGRGLVAPRCAQCERSNVAMNQRVDDGQICKRCYDVNHRTRCDRCGNTRRVTHRQSDGSGCCDPCLRAERDDVHDCAGCGRRRQVAGHLDDGRPLCAGCLRRGAHVEVCTGCHLDSITTSTPAGQRCGPCRAARAAVGDARLRQAGRTAVIVAAVQAVVPAAPTPLIEQAIDHAAQAPIKRARLAEHLTAHPDALTSGESTSPKAVGHLIAALNLLGVTGLAAPRCAACAQPAELEHTADGGLRICAACYQRRHVAACGGCGRDRPVVARHLDGTPRCSRCHSRAGAQPCGDCGHVKQVARRTADGTPRCSACVARDPTRWDICSGCGAHRRVNARNADGTAVCHACYTGPLATCDLCGRLAPVSTRRGGTIICRYCYRGRIDHCQRCRRHAVCRTSPDGVDVWCLHCLLAHRVDELLTRGDGTIDPAWDLLRATISHVGYPRTTLGWLRRSPAVAVLQAMGAGTAPVTHATLDHATGGRRRPSIEHVRGLLVAVDVLPERDNHLVRLEDRLDRLIAAAHPDDRTPLRLYTRWRLIARVRRASHAGRDTAGRADAAQSQLRESADFLAWLRHHDVALTDATQGQLDQWASEHPGHIGTIKTFLAWAAASGRAPRLDLATVRGSYPTVVSTDEHRWTLARQALNDDTWTASDRVAAALTLLYAQTPSQIARLTRRHVHADDQQVRLRLGTDPVTIPEPLAQLLLSLPEPRRRGLAAAVIDPTDWLFPGDRPGHHVHPSTIARRLRHHDIQPRAVRNAALLHLVTVAPTPVLADLLGLHPTTAEHWRAAAGARYANYPSQRHPPSARP